MDSCAGSSSAVRRQSKSGLLGQCWVDSSEVRLSTFGCRLLFSRSFGGEEGQHPDAKDDDRAQQGLAEAIFPDDADIQAPVIQGVSQDNLS